MFSGEYSYTLDGKGRLTLPARFRDELAHGVFITRGLDGCLFVFADAEIKGKTVVVSSPDLKNPVAVRYAWASNPDCTLVNSAGLPASPFRTDEWDR